MNPVVIVPTYNELANIDLLVNELLALPVGLHIIVVDDGSPDGTGQRADELAAADKRVHVIHRPRKMGLGTAYIAGFKRALESSYDRIFTMDADFSHNPRAIPAMLELSKSCDLVIGSRYVPGGKVQDCTWPRRMISHGANMFARTMLGLRANDCTAGFRCYRREVLKAVNLDAILANGYSFLIEMIYYVQKLGSTVGEVPITFENRQRGKSKISKKEIYNAIFTVLRLAGQRGRATNRQN